MKQYFSSMVVLTMVAGLAVASGNGNKGNSGGSRGNVGSSVGGSGNGSGKFKSSSDSSKSQSNGSNAGSSKSSGNSNFKNDPKLHSQMLNKYNVPKSLHNLCFFQHDFSYSHSCWLPSYGCRGYWHANSHCWYYWYEPCCCYVPCTYIETYAPGAATTQSAVKTNDDEDDD